MAARATAEKKTVGQRSYRVACAAGDGAGFLLRKDSFTAGKHVSIMQDKSMQT
ncbi:hypothetical protein HNR59_003180 [Aquamicrobium lusatiense]|uniref:Uncharacterized protein n=1 Tax=Aquamicrobium lusatiense TaxID=89772 RepID=A0A7W9VWI6_9HYPH|nr:hypothetical protein [Aquamicrobium lusatiense]